MIQKIMDFININHMLEEGDRVVAGISGGADSVCLLHVLNQIRTNKNLQIFVVHVNHGIRGEEAKRDEEFVNRLCNKLNIPCFIFPFDVRGIAKSEGLTEEEAGRKVRYQAFVETCKTNKCNKLAIAHNKNDNAETMLFHLFRGSGIKGLTGIAPDREVEEYPNKIRIIRPLLCVNREEIEAYLENMGATYQTDSTNMSDQYSRNKIRNHVLSYAAKEINPNSVEHMWEASSSLREIEEYIQINTLNSYKRLVKETKDCYRILVADLSKEHIVIQKELIRRTLGMLTNNLKDMEAKHISQVLALSDKQVGKYINLPGNIISVREYDYIKIYKGMKQEAGLSARKQNLLIEKLGKYYLQEHHLVVGFKIIENEKNMIIPKNKYTKWFDYDKIINTVEIRTRKEGDYIQINQFGGRKKLKDYFIDQKIPKEDRSNILLAADGNHIMWIDYAEGRISERYKIDNHTKRILEMSLSDMEENEYERKN